MICLDAISRGAALGLWLAVWLPATWAEPASEQGVIFKRERRIVPKYHLSEAVPGRTGVI